MRSRQHVRRDGETNPLRDFEVDRQVDFRRLLHWEIGGLFALQERGGGADVGQPGAKRRCLEKSSDACISAGGSGFCGGAV
jgi:hypothetical protein